MAINGWLLLLSSQHDQGEVSYQAGSEVIDFSNQLYGDNRDVRTSTPQRTENRDWAERLKKDSDVLARHNLDPNKVMKRNDIKVSWEEEFLEH